MTFRSEHSVLKNTIGHGHIFTPYQVCFHLSSLWMLWKHLSQFQHGLMLLHVAGLWAVLWSWAFFWCNRVNLALTSWLISIQLGEGGLEASLPVHLENLALVRWRGVHLNQWSIRKKHFHQFVLGSGNQFCGTFTSGQTEEDLQEQNCKTPFSQISLDEYLQSLVCKKATSKIQTHLKKNKQKNYGRLFKIFAFHLLIVNALKMKYHFHFSVKVSTKSEFHPKYFRVICKIFLCTISIDYLCRCIWKEATLIIYNMF